ncbi:nucleotide excision repair endonuclease [candidate division KSB1 bacterium]|nr:nucleotide excision repair endonuclease [candidate division KSB1 bacterium]
MYEHIVKYLREKAAPASASEIVNQVLKIKGGDEQTAEQILRPILKDAENIYYTKNGLIELKQGGAESVQEDEHIVFCKIIPASSRSISQWNSLQLVFYRRNKELERYNFFEHAPATQLNPLQLRSHFEQIRNLIKNFPIVFDGFGNQISLFKCTMLKLTGKDLENPVISLYRVAKRIFPDIKIQDPAHLSFLLGGRGYKDAVMEIQMNSLIEQFFSLRQFCYDKEVTSLTELIEFQEIKKTKVDFGGYAFNDAFLENLPSDPGVYIMKNEAEQVIYVGKSKNLYNRLNSYFTGLEKVEKKLEKIRFEIHDIEIILTGSELEALLLEQELIDQYKPPINRQLEVHERIRKERYIYKRILFLPSATMDKIKLYFIDPQTGLRSMEVQADGSNIDEIAEEATLFLNSDKKNHYDKRLDLVASWLYHNEDHVNSIDIRKYADFGEVIRLIKDFTKTLKEDFSRVVHY